MLLTHWGRMMHICVSKQTIIGSDNGLSPGRRQAIIWINSGMLFIGSLGINFNEILIKNLYILFQENPFENIVWKMASILSRSQCVNMYRRYGSNLQIFCFPTAPGRYIMPGHKLNFQKYISDIFHWNGLPYKMYSCFIKNHFPRAVNESNLSN